MQIPFGICFLGIEERKYMKLVTARYDDEEFIGVLIEGKGIAPMGGCNLPYHTMNEFIANATAYEMKFLARISREYQDLIPLDEVEFCAPIPDVHQDVICLGMNYAPHQRTTKTDAEQLPVKNQEPAVYFSKRVTIPRGNYDDIALPMQLSQQYDYEAELGIIIGRDAYSIRKEDAQDYIFGYTVINDLTARDLQQKHQQWYYGKSLDGFLPMGPSITTADEFSFPPALSIETRVNGQLCQHGSTKDMIHGIPEIIADLTQGMTLKAGTIISTGTPQDTAAENQHRSFLKPGDVVECTIQGIGTLTNTMTAHE